MKKLLCAVLALVLLLLTASCALAYTFDTTFDEYRFCAWEEEEHQYFSIAHNDVPFVIFENNGRMSTLDADGNVIMDAAFAEVPMGMQGMMMVTASYTQCEDLDYDCYYITFRQLLENWTVIVTNRVLPLTAGNVKSENEIIDFTASMDIPGSRYYLCKHWLIEVQ